MSLTSFAKKNLLVMSVENILYELAEHDKFYTYILRRDLYNIETHDLLVLEKRLRATLESFNSYRSK